MRIRITYLITVVVSVLIVFIGNKITANDYFNFQGGAHEVVRARVQELTGIYEPGREFDDLPFQITRIIFEARVLGGARNGEIITATQSLGGIRGVTVREVEAGDSILLIHTNNEWHFNGYLRTNNMLILGILFTICVLFFGRKKGFNTLLSLSLTFGAIFGVFIPSILSGKNIYVMAILVCIYTIVMTLLIVIGFNKKALTAAIGCAGGVLVTGIITVIMNSVMRLTGMVDEYSRFLVNLPVENPINLRGIIFAGIIIGAMGAIMDVAMSISSSLWELKKEAGVIKFETFLRSGLTIGKDIFGTMANTLILAYIGTSLSVVLILGVFSNSLLCLFNSEMIVVEILQALAGSFGILFTMPLTALICAFFYSKENNNIKKVV